MKSALANKYNLIGRAPHFKSWLATLQPLSIVLIKNSGVTLSTLELDNTNPHGPTVIRGRVLPYISHIGMCRSKEYGFCAIFGLKTGIGYAFRGYYGSV